MGVGSCEGVVLGSMEGWPLNEGASLQSFVGTIDRLGAGVGGEVGPAVGGDVGRTDGGCVGV